MAAEVALHYRFDPNSEVALLKVRGGSRQLRQGIVHPGVDEEVGRQRADADGSVTFVAGVEMSAAYIAVGRLDHHPIEVRARGREADDAEVVQPPVKPTRSRQILPARGKPTAQSGPVD